MHEFEWVRVSRVEDALAALSATPGARLVAGGTNLVDLMKGGIESPPVVIDINGLDELSTIEVREDGSLCIGALVRNSDLAWHPMVRARFPMIARALLAGATTQIRNMASLGGNLLQKTRCFYYGDRESNCNKRRPGSGCDAMEGVNRMCAVLGVSDACIAAHPSDVCLALRALDAIIHVQSVRGSRQIRCADFYRLPEDTPDVEFDLAPDELIRAIEVPPLPIAAHSTYLKLRDRTSYAFALVSVAAALSVQEERVAGVRLAVGGVGTMPWRSEAAEDAMLGRPAAPETFVQAAEIVFHGAKPRQGNAFKIGLAQRAVVRVLTELSGGPS